MSDSCEKRSEKKRSGSSPSKVWGYENSMNIETRTVDMHIGQLRKKIGKEAERIVTVKSVGYRFDGE